MQHFGVMKNVIHFVDYQLAFYGYCGKNLEDAIAIDNVVVDTPPATTTSPSTTTALTVETMSTSTETPASSTGLF